MTNSWEIEYNNIHGNYQDELDEDAHLLTIGIDVWKKHIDDVCQIVNNADLNIANWARFKYYVLKEEKKLPQQIFTWPINSDGKFQIGVKYNVLGNDQNRYYLAYMAIENIWGTFDQDVEDIPYIIK